MKLICKRKGQTNLANLGITILAIVVAVIIIAFLSTILTEFEGLQDDDTASKPFDTLTWAGNNTAIGFIESRVDTGSVILYNNGSSVNKGENYTVTEGSITITNISGTKDPEWITDDINVSYNYFIGSHARNISTTGISANLTFASFVPVIAIVAISAIIIGLVLFMFGRRKP